MITDKIKIQKQKKFFAALCLAVVMFSVGCSEGAGSPNAVSSENSGISDVSEFELSQNDIGLQEAVSAALNHAGLDRNNVEILKTRLESDDNILKYDIEFVTETDKYEYEINASSGIVLEFSSERLSESLISSDSKAPAENENSVTSANTAETDKIKDNVVSSVSKDTVPGAQTVMTSGITAEEAKTFALTHAGVSSDTAVFTKVKLDSDDGISVYDIEFTANSTEYDYEIKADDGTVLEYSSKNIISAPVQTVAPNAQTAASSAVTAEEAKTYALTHAGVSFENAVFTKVKLDNDDGISVYDIEFTANSTEYDYEIKADDGTVLEYSSKNIISAPVQTVVPNAQTSASSAITAEEAKTFALTHAGVSSGNAVFTKVKLDNDDGISVYDIEFTANSTEYEYEIKAADGAVLKYSTEPVYAAAQNGVSENISTEDAKNIALNYVGIASSQAVFTKTDLEYDDGIYIYEIEFTANSAEYEFEIAADSGTVLDYSCENQQYIDDHHYEDHHYDYHH